RVAGAEVGDEGGAVLRTGSGEGLGDAVHGGKAIRAKSPAPRKGFFQGR
ncbi:MAG: hypothetical protein RIQ79_2001, partial [Verrucomicrobiota bacterium]